jgi:molecular chaperone DnaK
MSKIIGIDLGTTYSAASTIDDTGRPIIVHNSDGKNITPSCILLNEKGILEVGEEARRSLGVSNNTAGRFKRDMGTNIKYTLGDKEYSPTDLSSVVLKKLVQDAQKTIGDISQAVVTTPANFANEARDATMEAAKKAGLNVEFIINEPTAAALYYAYQGDDEYGGYYAVYDFGGGTFDISVVKIDGQEIDVIATNGVSKLGGDDFDEELIKLVFSKYKDLTGDALEKEDFTKTDAEEEKKSLSKRDKVVIRVNKKIIEVTKLEYEEKIEGLIAQAEMLCETTVDEANIKISDLNGVFLVGGSTRTPSVLKSVKDLFQQEPISTANVDEVVALGAALYAAHKGDKSNLSSIQKKAIEKITVTESTSKCFGTLALGVNESRNIQEMQNMTIIRKGEKIPAKKTDSVYTIHENQEMISCKVTESVNEETDPNFVKIIWEGDLELPPGRPEGQEIQVTYEYDQNQMMKCSFLDVGTNKKSEVDLSMSKKDQVNEKSEIDKFLVE